MSNDAGTSPSHFLSILMLLHLLLCCVLDCGAATRTVTMGLSANSVPRYDFLEITLNVANPVAANPFADVTVSATFNLQGTAAQSIDGFCDAMDGTVYRVRMAPRELGTYQFTVQYTDAAGSVPFSGTFQSVAGTLPGFLRADPSYPLHFKWEGGTRVYPIGNTVYGMLGLTSENEIFASIDFFLSKGINRLRFCNQCELNNGEFGAFFDSTWNGVLHPWDGNNKNRFKVSHWQKVERTLRYMRERNMIAAVVMTVDRGSGQLNAGSAEEDRYYRYGVARYAAFSNVTFDLGNEHNEYRAVPGWANRLGGLMKQWNPYDNLTSAHAYEAHVYKNAAGTEWCDWQIFQQYGSPFQVNAHILNNRNAPQPAVNEEYGYEGTSGGYGHGQNATVMRKDAWAIALGGGYLTTGDWLAAFVTGKIGPALAIQNGIYKHLGTFFADKSYWLMAPNNALASRGFCLARGNLEYIVYVDTGGSFTVNLTAASGSLPVRWFNVLTGTYMQATAVQGGATRTFNTPDGNDWVLHIGGTPPDATPPSAPTGLSAAPNGPSRIDLSWNPAADPESGIGQYHVYRNGVRVGSPAGTSYSDTGLNQGTTYSYQVSAVNGAGLEGNKSSPPVSATTPVNPNAPVAQDGSATTQEDTPVSILLSASDPDGNPLTYSIVASPSKGTLSGTAPNLAYTPQANVNGSDSFTFKANDGTADSNVAVVSISITPVNDAPVALSQSGSTAPGTALYTQLTLSDPDGPGPFAYQIVTPPANGVLSGPNNDITYTPNAGFLGTASFSWRASDGLVWSNTATWTIVVGGGLLAHWKLDDGSGTSAADASGNGHTGTLAGGPVWSTGMAAGALQLDGSGDYVSVPNAAALDLSGKPFTLAAWVKSGNNSKSHVILAKAGGANYRSYYFALNRDDLRGGQFSLWTTQELGSQGWIDSQGSVTNGNWRHVAAVYDHAGQAVRLYRDGVLDKQVSTVTAGYAPVTEPLLLGRRADNATWDLNGLLDDVRIYNRALGAAEIAGLANAAPINQAPSVDAGAAASITLPTNAVALDATVTDDGLPNPPGALTVAWSKFSGPGTVSFGNASAVDTTATFSSSGVYVLRLTASDGALQSSDDVTITVNAEPAALPSAPANLTAAAVSSSRIDLAWTDTANNETGFKIERAQGTGTLTVTLKTYDGANTAPSVQAAGSANSFKAGALVVNDRGDTWRSVPAGLNGLARLLTARDDRLGMGSPPDLVVYAVTVSGPCTIHLPLDPRYGGAKLSWMDASWTDSGLTCNSSASNNGWKIWKKSVAVAGDVALGCDEQPFDGVCYVFEGGSSFVQVATVGSNVTNYSNTGLLANTGCTYRVRATNAAGDSAYSNTAAATTQGGANQPPQITVAPSATPNPVVLP